MLVGVVLIQCPVDRLRGGGAVLRMHGRDEGLVVPRGAWGPSKERAVGIGPDDLVGVQVPMPGAHLRPIERQAQALFAAAQAFLGLLALGDVQGTPDVANERAILVAVRMRQLIEPAHATVGTDDPVLQFVDRAVCDGGA